MTTAYTSLLGLALPVTGELQGTWGDVVNDSITSLLDTAIAGTTSLTTDTDTTLSDTDGASNQSRQAIVLWNPASGTVTRNITAPARSKTYVVINATGGTQSIVFRGVGPTTGVTILAGEKAVVAWNGSDFVKVSTFGGSPSFTNVTVTGTTTLSGLTASTALALNGSKEVVSVTNTGSGNNVLATSPTLVTPVLGAATATSINGLTVSSTTGTLTLDNGSTLATSGANSLTLTTTGATNVTFPTSGTLATTAGTVATFSAGTTGFTPSSATSGAVTLAGTLATTNGGTGLTSFTSGGVVYASSTSALTTGSALTFDGTNLTVPAEVYRTSATSYVRLAGGDAAAAGAHVLAFGQSHASAPGRLALGASGTGPIIFDLNGSEQMRLTSTGLGIGTSSPGAKLDVRGTIASTTTQSIVINGTTGTYATVQYNGTSIGDIGTGNQVFSGGTTTDLAITARSGYRLVLGSNGTAQATLDSSGNLGLGVTPSAWGSGLRSYDLGTYGSVYTSGGLAITGIGSNAYNNDTNWIYKTSNPAFRFDTDLNKGFAWFTAPSGTAGNAISFTQAMTLDASSNLFVGGTTGSAKLNLQTTTNSSSDSEYIRLYNAGENVGYISWINGNGDLARITGTKTGGGASANDGILTFSTALDASLTERARITSGGYFKASNNGTYLSSTGAYHELTASGADADYIVNITTPVATAANCYGARVYYTGAAPNGTGNTFLACQDNAATRATIRSNGGIANYQSNNVDLSDIRTKTNINPIGSYWGKIANIEIVTYRYKDQTHDDLNIGVIAQQVEQVAPEFVDSDGFGDVPEDGVPLKTIYNKDLTFAAIKALQEAMARIEQLEARLAAAGI